MSRVESRRKDRPIPQRNRIFRDPSRCPKLRWRNANGPVIETEDRTPGATAPLPYQIAFGTSCRSRRKFSTSITVRENWFHSTVVSLTPVVFDIDPDSLSVPYMLAILYRRLGKMSESAKQEAIFTDEKMDPMVAIKTQKYYNAHRDIANEAVPWHVHKEPGAMKTDSSLQLPEP